MQTGVYVFKELLLTKKAGRILKLAVIGITTNKNLKNYEGEHRKQTKTVHIMILKELC